MSETGGIGFDTETHVQPVRTRAEVNRFKTRSISFRLAVAVAFCKGSALARVFSRGYCHCKIIKFAGFTPAKRLSVAVSDGPSSVEPAAIAWYIGCLNGT